jgi:hypothetical protein
VDLTSYPWLLPLLAGLFFLSLSIYDALRKRSMDKRVDKMAASLGLKRMQGESTSELCDRISDRFADQHHLKMH